MYIFWYKVTANSSTITDTEFDLNWYKVIIYTQIIYTELCCFIPLKYCRTTTQPFPITSTLTSSG